MTLRTDWIAVDWGTSSLRAWAMDSAGHALADLSSDCGMGGLSPAEFEPALLALVEPWLADGRCWPVVACGMVGARQGWIEAPYREVPCAPTAAGKLTIASTRDPRLSVQIAAGICQTDPPDVMRGEETQIAGFLAESNYKGVICLPGTHTKWVTIQDGLITSFRTMMTGEIFALLAEQSVLQHSVGEGWDQTAFAAAVEQAQSSPQDLAGALFSIRAGSLLHNVAPAKARATLSGQLIGAELAAVRPAPGPVAVLGADALADVYRSALELTGHEVQMVDAETATLRGLVQLRQSMNEAA